MEPFSYNNIFDTKGIEYLVVIAFFALLIPFWIILNRKVKISGQIRNALGIMSARTLKIPQGLFYSRNHTWTHLERSGIANIGLDDLLLHITGDVKFSNLKKTGEKITKGDLLAEIDHKGKTLSILSPVSGEILDTNSILTDNPALLNEDPYVKGWMYKVRPVSWIADTKSYYVAEDATHWLQKELDRFKDFLSEATEKFSPWPGRLVLQDGGELIDNALSDLPEEVWNNFQKDFLNHPDAPAKKG